MTKKITFSSLLLLAFLAARAQSLPLTFESGITAANFIDFDGGTASVEPNPSATGANTSATVAKIVRNGGTIWSGSKLKLAQKLNFSTQNTLSMAVFTTAPIGTTVKFKLEAAGQAPTERDVKTKTTGAWEVMTWDFTGAGPIYDDLVFMFDFGNVGNGSAASTFYFDDIVQGVGTSGAQLDLPVDFENAAINYTLTDFGGTVSELVADPANAANKCARTLKTGTAESWAGTTIGTAAGFAKKIPLALTDSKMNVRVWSPAAGKPVRLKVENATDPTQTCETEKTTTIAGAWEVLEFDFLNQAPGTESLSVGLSKGWTYQKASIFFNFGTLGSAVGPEIYFFDDVRFGPAVSSTGAAAADFLGLQIFPNPTEDAWTIFSSEEKAIRSVELFDSFGRLVFVEKMNAATAKIDGSRLSAGLFWAKISGEAGSRFVRLLKN